MPEIGSCDVKTCDDNIKELYECHCCLRLVCLNHLNDHVELKKQNQRQLDNLRNELNTAINKLKIIVEEKLLIIGHEQYLIEQAKHFLDVPTSSIDELQNILGRINQAIPFSRSEITMKVEPTLSETKHCSCVCQCNNENMNSNDVAEEFGISKNDRYSMQIDDDDSMDATSFDTTTKSIKDQNVNKEQKKRERRLCTSSYGKCPLTFDGAFGLTQTNHSITLCKHEKNHETVLYGHFINKHRLKAACAVSLVKAIADKQDPRITKLFDGNETVVNLKYSVLCPCRNGRIDVPGYSRQKGKNVRCQRRLVPFNALKYHLRNHHYISKQLAQKLVDDLKEITTENDIVLPSPNVSI
ncbi:unnamed protein product [Rotaria socialis]|uniref:Uncharacterized protein n=1 Tax=Rotaria socialis TaxID=392032 RepID=A0A818DYR1_9BILA|nr:unnamed protein product [Rotaria socialis]CAF3349480.1 unnamed protein product [Rotaria socialis]CAF3433195.1 unnamed protein product [Rotaria socialis]CAF3449458.1 unnamed protein product [Rotaria socialis]CAF3778562.1 unnamed protein product [Rotaria socialis]